MWSRARSAVVAVCLSVAVVAGGSPAAADDAAPQGPFTCSPSVSAFVTAPGSDSVGVYAAGDSSLLCRIFQVSVTVTDSTSGQSLYSGTIGATGSFTSTYTVARGDTVVIEATQHFTTVQASASVVPVAPGPVTSLVASAATQTSLQLDWVAPVSDGGAPISGYVIDWGAGTTQTSTTEVVVSGLAPGTTYTFAVTAVNAAGSSVATTVTATTIAKPTPPAPTPGPAPAPNPQPVAITTITVAAPIAGNVDGSLDIDQSPRTIQQTVPGTWPKSSRLVSGKKATLGRLAGLRTNAGQQAVMSVTYLSPSVRSASVSIDGRGRVVGVTATLAKGKKSGAIVLTVSAAPTTAGDVGYEGIQASRRFVVRPA